MPLDGVMLHAIGRELQDYCGARVDKITQPERDEVVLSLHGARSGRLQISVNASQPRMHMISYQKENPQKALNFCMLLRKHLTNAKLLSVEQPGLERLLILKFEARNELFDMEEKQLIVEMMGRYSNIILTDAEGKIHDALKQIDFAASEIRQLLPGLYYELPPSQGKKNFLEAELDFVPQNDRLDKALMAEFEGFSPLFCREIAYRLCGATDVRSTDVDPNALRQVLLQFRDRLVNRDFAPTLLIVDGSPKEYYCFEIGQYGQSAQAESFESCSAVMNAFFEEKDKKEHIRKNAADILKIVSNAVTRVTRRIEIQKGDLAACADSDIYRVYGDLLTANLYHLTQGAETVTLLNYETGENVEIPLSPSLTPAKNAQRYYKLFKKSQTAKEILSEQIPKGLQELEYLQTVSDALNRAESLQGLAEIRVELAQSGYLKQLENKGKKGQKKEAPIRPIQYETDGFLILIGRNNIQNDYLTFRAAERRDLWFHVKNAPGSHVILVRDGKEPTNQVMTRAAELAAYYSSLSNAEKVEVDYTEVRHVKKQSGAQPGMVNYEQYKTAYVAPKGIET